MYTANAPKPTANIITIKSITQPKKRKKEEKSNKSGIIYNYHCYILINLIDSAAYGFDDSQKQQTIKI